MDLPDGDEFGSLVYVFGALSRSDQAVVLLTTLNFHLGMTPALRDLHHASISGLWNPSAPLRESHSIAVRALLMLNSEKAWWPLFEDFDAFMVYVSLT